MGIRRNISLCIILLLGITVMQCSKKDRDELLQGKVKEESMGKKVIIPAPERYQGLWLTNDIRMARFVGHKGTLKYPDYYMHIDVDKREVKLRFVYDNTKTVYKLKIEFIDVTDEKIKKNAKVVNEKGEERELLIDDEYYIKYGDKRQMVFKFKDTEGDRVTVGEIKEPIFGRFTEGVSSGCISWDTIESCIEIIKGEYELAEIEAKRDRIE